MARGHRPKGGHATEEIDRVKFLVLVFTDATNSIMFPYIAHQRDKVWRPGPYPGVQLLVLHQDEQTQGLTLLRKFEAGAIIPAHVHPQANEYAYVLSGQWEESGVVYEAGSFFFAPRGQLHGPHAAKTEVLSLTHFDGPLTFA